MAFPKLEKTKYPLRLWSIVGHPGSGKTTFATAMRMPALVVDADHRFSEVLGLAGEVYSLSTTPADHGDPDRVAAILAANMPGSGVRTIIVDSLTAIIAPLVTQNMVDWDKGEIKNLSAGWRAKALAVRLLQDAVTRWATDCLWIYHLQRGRDEKAQKVIRATISETERARLLRSINLQLEVVQKGERRGVKVTWARRGRAGMTLWDETGKWAGMPEAIEAAVYDGLTEADQEAIESTPPAVFSDPATAIAWGLEQGAFKALQHSRNAYDQLKREKSPATAREMTALWIEDVARRKAAALAGEGEP